MSAWSSRATRQRSNAGAQLLLVRRGRQRHEAFIPAGDGRARRLVRVLGRRGRRDEPRVVRSRRRPLRHVRGVPGPAAVPHRPADHAADAAHRLPARPPPTRRESRTTAATGRAAPTGATRTPYTYPVVANFTLIGTNNNATSGSSGGVGVMLRRGTGGFYVNGVVSRWSRGAISVRDAETYAARREFAPTPDLATTDLAVQNVLIAESALAFQTGTGQNAFDMVDQQHRPGSHADDRHLHGVPGDHRYDDNRSGVRLDAGCGVARCDGWPGHVHRQAGHGGWVGCDRDRLSRSGGTWRREVVAGLDGLRPAMTRRRSIEDSDGSRAPTSVGPQVAARPCFAALLLPSVVTARAAKATLRPASTPRARTLSHSSGRTRSIARNRATSSTASCPWMSSFVGFVLA